MWENMIYYKGGQTRPNIGSGFVAFISIILNEVKGGISNGIC